MGNENQTILDRLSHKHELRSLNLDYPECYQVLQVTQDGRDLQALFYDGTRVGELLASAMVGEIVFLLCRHDKDHGYGQASWACWWSPSRTPTADIGP